MIKAHPFTLLSIWMLMFAVNSLFLPVYLRLFGPLGGVFLLSGLCLLAATAMFMTYKAVTLAKRSNRVVFYLICYAIAPFLIMAACGLFLIRPLSEFSYVIIYGPRHATH